MLAVDPHWVERLRYVAVQTINNDENVEGTTSVSVPTSRLRGHLQRRKSSRSDSYCRT